MDRPERAGVAGRADHRRRPGRGTRCSELEEPGRVRVAAVGRLGVAQVPRPDLVAQEGDVLYLAVASDALDAVDEMLAAGPAKGGH